MLIKSSAEHLHYNFWKCLNTHTLCGWSGLNTHSVCGRNGLNTHGLLIFYLCKITEGMLMEIYILIAFIKVNMSCGKLPQVYSHCEISRINFDLVNVTLLLIDAERCFQTLRIGPKWGSGACPFAHAHAHANLPTLPRPHAYCWSSVPRSGSDCSLAAHCRWAFQ